MLLNPVIANLCNAKTNRYHPILFVESPLPGAALGVTPVRHKSKGHHTSGFDNRDDAIEKCIQMVDELREDSSTKPKLCIGEDFSWDGEDIPAMVAFFSENYLNDHS